MKTCIDLLSNSYLYCSNCWDSHLIMVDANPNNCLINKCADRLSKIGFNAVYKLINKHAYDLFFLEVAIKEYFPFLLPKLENIILLK